MFARGLSMAAVIWAIDSGLVTIEERDLAQDVLEQLWQAGPIRPDLIGAQLQCLVGQGPGERQCPWTCPAMRRANAGSAVPDEAIRRPALPDLVWTVVESATTAAVHEHATTAAVHEHAPVPRAPRWVPRRGARVRCRECGRTGTVLDTNADDGWTVIDHRLPVAQREDSMWEVQPDPDAGPRQCRYLSRFEAACVV